MYFLFTFYHFILVFCLDFASFHLIYSSLRGRNIFYTKMQIKIYAETPRSDSSNWFKTGGWDGFLALGAFTRFLMYFLFRESEYSSRLYTGIPWQAGLRRGSALEADHDSMFVREEGYYFVYSQVGLFVVISWFFHKGVLLVCLPITRFYIGREHVYIHSRKKGVLELSIQLVNRPWRKVRQRRENANDARIINQRANAKPPTWPFIHVKTHAS